MKSLTSLLTQVKTLVIVGVGISSIGLVGLVLSNSNESSPGNADTSAASSTTSTPGPRPLAPLGNHHQLHLQPPNYVTSQQ